jgi:hypothetical protein
MLITPSSWGSQLVVNHTPGGTAVHEPEVTGATISASVGSGVKEEVGCCCAGRRCCHDRIDAGGRCCRHCHPWQEERAHVERPRRWGGRFGR